MLYSERGREGRTTGQSGSCSFTSGFEAERIPVTGLVTPDFDALLGR